MTFKKLQNRAELHGLKLTIVTGYQKYRLESNVCYAHRENLKQINDEIDFYVVNKKFRTQRSITV